MQDDIITAINNQHIHSMQDLDHILATTHILDPLHLRIARIIPLDMDWDGRSQQFQIEQKQVSVTPVQVDIDLHGQDIESYLVT